MNKKIKLLKETIQLKMNEKEMKQNHERVWEEIRKYIKRTPRNLVIQQSWYEIKRLAFNKLKLDTWIYNLCYACLFSKGNKKYSQKNCYICPCFKNDCYSLKNPYRQLLDGYSKTGSNFITKRKALDLIIIIRDSWGG